MDEEWVTIPDFGDYKISNLGRIFNQRTDRIMSSRPNNHGHVKITLVMDWTRRRYTKSVALLVADAFLPEPPIHWDQLVVLDGDFTNLAATNLAWRPKGFAWKYTQQMKTEQPVHYQNLPVVNVETDDEYECIIHAAVSEGLLFDDVWRSTYTGDPVFPTGSVFEVVAN